MRLQYFGTAAAEGWPGLFCHCEFCREARRLGGKNIRTRSQALLDRRILFDFPPDTYLHMLRDGLDLPGIQSVLVTHTHQDHFYPDDLLFRSPGFAHGVKDTLTFYGNDAVAGRLQTFLAACRRDGQLTGGEVACREIAPYQPVEIEGYLVSAMLANHDRSERCYIYLIEREGQTLLYGNDTGIFPEKTWAYLADRKLSLVSLDCTTGYRKEGRNHMGVPDVIEVKERLVKMGCADESTRFIATHFSHNGRLLYDQLVTALSPHRIGVAYDGMTAEV